MFENVFAHDNDQKHAVEKIKKDNQTLKEENALLKKEIETFKERVQDLEKKPNEFINYKIGLEYTDPCPLGQAIACTPKLYDAEVLGLHYVQPDVNDTEEILNDAEANESDVPPKEMSNKSKLLKLFSMERKVDRTSKKNEILQNKIDQLLEVNIDNDVRNLVMKSYVEIKNKEEIGRFSKESKDSDKFINDVVEVKEKLSKQINAFADEVKRLTGKLTAFDKENCDFGSKVTHLKKIIAQKTKDCDDVKLELSNRTAKFEAYFEKLENTKVVPEQQLARKVDNYKAEKDQFLKEINHLRTQL
ncbi:hypothetical protein Tco_1562112 [Tanacetum coccineum]